MMFHFKNAFLSIFGLIVSASIAAAGYSYADPASVHAPLVQEGASAPQATATPKPSALLTFSMLGTATSILDNSGACSGVTCNSSAGGCSCLTLQGTLNGTQVGAASWTSSVTVNTDDCPNTGTTTSSGPGFCCYAGGPLNVTTAGKSPSKLGMSFTGLFCEDPNASLQFSIQGGFIITGANSSGKFANSAGVGQLDMFVGDDPNGTTYLSGNGVLQVVSPF